MNAAQAILRLPLSIRAQIDACLECVHMMVKDIVDLNPCIIYKYLHYVG